MNRSVLIALGLFLSLVIYMLTGLAGCRETQQAAQEEASTGQPVMTVQIREMEAEEIPRQVVMSGKTVPSRAVELKAETAGKVIEVGELRGKAVKKDTVIARIELNDREAQREQARASLEQARLEYEAAVRLQERELRSESQVAEALSRLRGAEQRLRQIELDIRNTSLVAPFDGVVQERFVEVGDYVGLGDPVARIIDLDPLVVEGNVTEFQISFMHIGEPGVAELADGREVEGTLRYVAGEGDSRTRTFPVELEAANPDGAIPAGITAQIRVETERVWAHRISPGLISISDEGRFGVKIVDDNNRVRFVEADIVRAEPDALWLTNLPREMRLITIGQGFTKTGDLVDVTIEEVEWH